MYTFHVGEHWRSHNHNEPQPFDKTATLDEDNETVALYLSPLLEKSCGNGILKTGVTNSHRLSSCKQI